MRVAVVDNATGEIRAVIMARQNDMPHPGTSLVIVPESRRDISQRWRWTEADGFHPGPELQAEIDADDAAVEADAYDWGGGA